MTSTTSTLLKMQRAIAGAFLLMAMTLFAITLLGQGAF